MTKKYAVIALVAQMLVGQAQGMSYVRRICPNLGIKHFSTKPVIFAFSDQIGKIEDPKDALVLCAHRSDPVYNGKSRNIWEAVAKCSSQSLPVACDHIKKFAAQMQVTEPVVYMHDLFYLYCRESSIRGGHGIKMTPLELAINAGAVQAVAALLENGANPSLQSEQYPYFSPLHHLVERSKRVSKDRDNAEVLIFKEKGVLPIGPGYSAKKDDYLKIAELLIAKGANLKAKEALGETPLQFCEDDLFGESGPELCDFLRAKSSEQPWYKKILSWV